MSFLEDAKIIIKELSEYLEESHSGKKPVISLQPLEGVINKFQLAQLVQNGDLSRDKLQQFIKAYLEASTRLHSSKFIGHQVAPPHYAGALGSFVDGFTNNAMAVYEMGPGAASIEYFMINWLLQKIGWTPAPFDSQAQEPGQYGGGVLTHGGSLANLTALVAARTKSCPDIWENGSPGNLAILTPYGCHYSIERAAGILGIGQKSIYYLDVDDKGAIIPTRMKYSYQKLIDDGKRPIALTADACSTSVGIYDPLAEIADFCKTHELWFHVDGAHGASALLSERHQHLLSGVDQADSITWDAHKMLRTPTLCAALLVRDHNSIDRAFEQHASYIFHEKDQMGFDFIHRSVECTKAGLGLRFFMAVAALGENELTRYIENQFDLTKQAYDYIHNLPDFQCAVEPQSNILCFRITGDDQKQLQIRKKLIADGEFYITTTCFQGKWYLRLSIMNPLTKMENIERLIQKIRLFR